MKKYLKPMYLPYCTLILGALSFLCMYWVHATGVDQRMLLNPAHPGAILTWIFCAAMIAAVIVLTQPLGGKLRYERIFPGSIVGAVGTGGVQIDADGAGSGSPDPEGGLLGSPVGTQVVADVGVCGFEILGGVNVGHGDFILLILVD